MTDWEPPGERTIANTDILEGTWVHLETATFSYEPVPGQTVARAVHVWAGLGGWRIAVVTEPGDDPTVAAAPVPAFAALRDRYGPEIVLIENYEPAPRNGHATPYMWLLEDGAGGVFTIPFDKAELERALPGLRREQP